MAFEKYTPPLNKSFLQKDKISIYPNCKMIFNKGFRYKNDIDKYNYVNLYFDKSTLRIAIEFLEERNDEALNISKNKADEVSITSKSFFNRFGIPIPKRVVAFDYSKENINGVEMYVIDLKESYEKI